MTQQITPIEKKQLMLKKDITDNVIANLDNLKNEGLALPPNYSPTNALKSAWFKILEVQTSDHKPAVEVCTQQSIINALMDMTIQGLSPAKTQCYFVTYGNKLQLNRSYFGTQAVIKRLSGVDDIWANVIYKDDEFEYINEGGRDKLVKHVSKLENRDKPIIGAYAIVKLANGEEIMTVMTMKEIETSWSQAKTDKVQKKFPQEMAKRTVINRAAKSFINTSDDSDILIEAINNTTANEYQNDNEKVEQEAKAIDVEVSRNANSVEFEEDYNVDEETGEVIEEPQEAPQPQPQPEAPSNNWAL